MRNTPALLALLLAAGCFSAEIPQHKPAENPLDSAPSARPTSDATKIEDRPNERKPSRPDEAQNKAVIGRATRQANKCPDIHTEGPFGSFQFQVIINGTKGKVVEAKLPAELASSPMGKCIEKAFEVESVPPWDGPDVSMPVQLELKKPAEAKPDAKPDPKKK